MSTLYLVTIKMDKVMVQGDWKKFSGSEVYFIGKVVDHSTGRSKSFKAGGATVVDLSATPPFEFLVDDSASIPFQEDNDLKVDGIPGPITQGKLQERHGC